MGDNKKLLLGDDEGKTKKNVSYFHVSGYNLKVEVR